MPKSPFKKRNKQEGDFLRRTPLLTYSIVINVAKLLDDGTFATELYMSKPWPGDDIDACLKLISNMEWQVISSRETGIQLVNTTGMGADGRRESRHLVPLRMFDLKHQMGRKRRNPAEADECRRIAVNIVNEAIRKYETNGG